MITTIKNDTIAVSADSHGAELYSIKAANGIEYLWDGNPDYWSGRAPILFPIVGSLRDERAQSASGEIVLARHGFAKFSEWKLEKADEESMTYILSSSSDTKKVYPYDFTLRVSYTLGESSLTNTFSVCNTGGYDMPFCIGGHPAFRIPLVEGEEFTDYIVEFEKPETADCSLVDLKKGLILNESRRFLTNQTTFRLNHDLFRNDALVFDNLKSRSVKLYSEKSGHGERMDFEGMDYFAVWTPVKDSPFVCLEPWTGTATLESEDDIFEHKRGMRLLKPGEESTVSFSVTVF